MNFKIFGTIRAGKLRYRLYHTLSLLLLVFL